MHLLVPSQPPYRVADMDFIDRILPTLFPALMVHTFPRLRRLENRFSIPWCHLHVQRSAFLECVHGPWLRSHTNGHA
jgi:hypothetical protein